MKKNNMLRIASVLLVAVLLSTCAISGAFAKYTTETATKTDTARVAKWGITATADNANPLFAKTYTNDGSITTVTSLTVDGEQDNVVAPGTDGTAASIKFAGSAEVAVAIQKTVSVDIDDNWMVGGAEYCPIVFTVGGETIRIDGGEINSIEKLENALIEAILGTDLTDEMKSVVDGVVYYTHTGATIAPNTELDDDYDISVSWAWAFEDDVPTNIDATDAKDTALATIENGENVPNITITVSAKVVQVD